MTEWIISSSALIVLVLALRFALGRRISLRLRYALWALVLVRLLVPVSFGSSAVSVGNVAKTEPAQFAAELSRIELPKMTYSAAKAQVAEEYAQRGIDIEQMPIEQYETVHYEVENKMRGDLSLAEAAKLIWLAGMGVMAAAFTASNLRFWRRLKRTRAPLSGAASPLPLYVSGAVETPCLFGIVHPAVYLTREAAADEATLRHALAHELTHHRHRDHIWSLLRGVCLAVHWYNPLVWCAAMLSRNDAELACDEATIHALGEDERAAYGRTLIRLTCEKHTALLRTATTMTGSGKSIKERITLIAKAPKTAVYAAAVVALIAIFAVGCTFTGAADGAVDETPNDPAPSGKYASMEAYVEDRMVQQTTAEYYSALTNALATANVLDTKIEYLEKQGEVEDLAEDGVLEAWSYCILTKLDVPTEDVMLVGGQHEQDGWFDLEGQGGRVTVALRYGDGTYDVLYDQVINDGLDFYGYHYTCEEAIYDWYVAEYDLDLPLYVVDFIDQITIPEGGYLGNMPAHRYDGDGWYIYIPVSAWERMGDTGDSWQSLYWTGSTLTVYYEKYTTALERMEHLASSGWEKVEGPELHARHSEYAVESYLYDAPNGGSYDVRIEWQRENITDYPYIAIEPDTLRVMAESFTPDARFVKPLIENPADTEMIERVVNGIFVDALSYDENYHSPGNYTLTAICSDGRQDVYSCTGHTYYAVDSTPGRWLLEGFDWSLSGASMKEGYDESDYTFHFENGTYALTAYSRENKLALTENGKTTIVVGTPRWPNQDGDAFAEVFQEFMQYAQEAEYKTEIWECSVSGSETDYDEIALELTRQFALQLMDRPPWYPQQTRNVVVYEAEVFDAYYGTDDPNFCFTTQLYMTMSDEQTHYWEVGAGLTYPTEGPHAGTYGWAREVNVHKHADGYWRMDGFASGGSGVSLPIDIEKVSARELMELHAMTSGLSHDWHIMRCLAKFPIEEVRAQLETLLPAQAAALREAFADFAEEYPDYIEWPVEEL